MKIAKLTLISLLICNFGFSQSFFTPYQGSLKSKLTLGASIGTVFQNTDAVGTPDFGNQVFTAINGGGMLSYRMTNNLSIRGYWAGGQIKADPTRPDIFKKGLQNFKTTYLEAGAMLEIDWFSRLKFDAQSQRFSISTLIGAGYMAFYPYDLNGKRSYRGRPVVVKGKPGDYRGYSDFTHSLSVGGNMKFYVNSQLALGLESIYRFTGTDFIDGIKAGKANDGFMTIMFTAHYTLEPNMSRFNYKLYLKKQYKKRPWR